MKIRILAVIGILCLLVIFIPQVAYASSSVTVYSTKDTTMRSDDPSSNFGNEIALYVNDGTYAARVLVHFDWGGSVPSGAVITGATLQLYYWNHVDADPVGETVTAYALRVPRWSWVELSSSWNYYKYQSVPWTLPGASSTSSDINTILSASASVPGSYGWMSWDVSAAILACDAAGYDEEGFRLSVYGGGDADVDWYSRDNGASKPKLTIYYDYPPTVTTGGSSSITSASAICAGSITSMGGSHPTIRGIQYGLTETATWNVHETGSFGTGSFSKNLTGLSPGTTYYYRAYATNPDGTGTGDWKSFTTSLSSPTVTTRPADGEAISSAILRGYLDDDGGSSCQVKFLYGTISGVYTEDSGWLSSTYRTGQSFSYSAIGLTSDTDYYYVAVASGDGGSVNGDEVSFTTLASLNPPTNLKATPRGPDEISLSWTKGIGAYQTLVRYKTGDYPSSTSDGSFACLVSSGSFTLSGLTAGTTYYIKAWGYDGTDYSTLYTTELATTSLGEISGSGTSSLVLPSRGLFETSYTNLVNMPIYGMVNNVADQLSMPRVSFWAIFLWFIAILVGVIAFFFSKSPIVGLWGACMVVIYGYLAGPIPGWQPIIFIGAIALIMYIQSK